jgi:hypothetical protein
MPKFRFTAVDEQGMFRDGTIDAPDGATARERLAANGLKVRELEEVESAGGEPPLFTTPPVVPTSGRGRRDEGDRPSAYKRPGPPSGSSKGTVFFAVAALVLVFASVGYSVYKNPPWGRLSKYDFSTPEAALKSQMKMDANADILASVEYQSKVRGKAIKEKIDTLEVKRTEDFDGKKVLFVQFKETDRETKKTEDRKVIEWFEKDDDSGLWKETYVSTSQVREKNEKLAKEIEDWTRRSKD